MKEMVCEYCKDEFCINDQCPMRADYCPVPDTPGVCRHEKRVTVKQKMSVRECVHAALAQCGVVAKQEIRTDVYHALSQILAENDWKIVKYDEKNIATDATDEKWMPGKIVTREDIIASDNWLHSHKETDEHGRESIVCVTEDGLLMVSFAEGEKCAAVMLNRPNENASKFFVGQRVNQFDIANSYDWVFDRKIKDHDIHESNVWVTRDHKFKVVFDDQSEEGIVALNQIIEDREQKELFAGETINLTDVEKSDVWKLKSFSSSPFDNSCSYVSKDDKYVVEFVHQADTGTIKEQYYPGMSVHVGRIGESPYWECAGSSHALAIYAAKDKSLFVAFDRNSDWGVIKRTLADLLR
jgi:hypothetical protein